MEGSVKTCAFEMLYHTLSTAEHESEVELRGFLDRHLALAGSYSPADAQQWQTQHPAPSVDSSDSWLDVSPEQVDDLLSRYAGRTKTKSSSKGSRSAPPQQASEEELASELQSIAASVRAFVERVDAVPVDHQQQQQQQQRVPRASEEDDESSSDTDDEFYGGAQEDDEEEELEEDDPEMVGFMQQMDQELRERGGRGDYKGLAGEDGCSQDDAMAANLLQQLLQSYGESGSDTNPFRSLLAMAQNANAAKRAHDANTR